ncbi:MAG: hypothetical protein ACM31D_04815 [Bacteroidota bacterium]
MQDRDWTGTAAAVTALALTAGVWLWPEEAPQNSTPPRAAALSHGVGDTRNADDLARWRNAEDLARWRAEAQRWDGTSDAVQLSAAGISEATPAIIR